MPPFNSNSSILTSPNPLYHKNSNLGKDQREASTLREQISLLFKDNNLTKVLINKTSLWALKYSNNSKPMLTNFSKWTLIMLPNYHPKSYNNNILHMIKWQTLAMITTKKSSFSIWAVSKVPTLPLPTTRTLNLR